MVQTDEFIDLKIYDYIKDFRKDKTEIYELLYESISILRSCEEKIQIKGPSRNNVYLLSMVMQFNKFYQGTILMFEHGMKDIGDSLIRTCLELSIKIVELIRNKNFVEEYELNSYFEMKTMTKVLIENELYDLVPRDTLLKTLDILNKKIKGKTKPKIKIIDLVRKNDMYREYVIYRLYCNYTHQSIEQMDNIISDDGFEVTIDGNFNIEKFDNSIAMLGSIYMVVVPILIEEYICDVKLEKEYKNFEVKFENFFIKK